MATVFLLQDIPHCSKYHPTMDDTPEEFLGLVDPAPPSPSVFLDLPLTPHGDGDPSSLPQDDLALDYISRMLMEEDMDDRFFYQHPNHPALLQAQQSLVHVISSPSSSSVHTNDTSSKLCPDMMQGSAFLASEADNTDLSGDVRSFSSDVAVQNLLFSHNAAEEAEKLLKVGTGDQTVLSSAPLSGAENINENVEYSDDPALLQAQQPFAQILSTISSGTNNDNTRPMGCAASLQGADRGNLEEAKGLLPGANGDLSTLSSAFSNSVDVVGAFLNGIEEASKFLPEENGFRRDEVVDQMFRESGTGRGCKNRYDREEQLEEAVGRTSKRVLMMADPEKVAAHEMFEDMMLHGFETCIKDMEKLHMAMDKDKEAEKKNSKGRSKAKRKVVDLRMLLIQCAQAVATDSHRSAGELLKEIKKHASPIGDATQRLARCFARGLEARLVGSGSQLCQLLSSKRISAVDFLKAYKVYTAACCFNRVAFTFSNMTILDAMAGKSRLHIVDYGMLYGLQWAALLYCLANREGGPPEVKITAIGLPQHVEETERCLSNCARELGLPFKFYAIASKWETVHVKDLNINPDEVLVVNELFAFRNLMDESVFFGSGQMCPRDAVLNNIREMRPDVFIQSIGNTSYGNTFLSRFREALFYYSALFDMLDATIPRESEPRLVLEQDMLGRTALNVIACQGADLVERPERYRQWQARNQRAGLRQLPLNPDIVKVVRDMVNKCHRKDFLLGEDGRWLLQGWMGRILFAHSTWVAEDTSSR